MSESAENRRQPPPRTFPLYKQLSWSPDTDRDEAWLRRKAQSKMRRSKSVTDDDLEELKACVELGFGFNSPEIHPRLSQTFPALRLYHAVHYNSGSVSQSSIINHGEDPEMVKERLKQWAQVVACSVRQY